MDRFVLDERGAVASSCWMSVGVVDGEVRVG